MAQDKINAIINKALDDGVTKEKSSDISTGNSDSIFNFEKKTEENNPINSKEGKIFQLFKLEEAKNPSSANSTQNNISPTPSTTHTNSSQKSAKEAFTNVIQNLQHERNKKLNNKKKEKEKKTKKNDFENEQDILHNGGIVIVHFKNNPVF